MNPLFKKILIGLAVVAVLGGAGIWYIFNEKFTDTTEVKADAIKKALELIHEFEKDNAAANKNYAFFC